MNAKTLLAGLLLAAVVAAAGWVTLDALSFERGGRIWVTGTSTVHDWTCEVDAFTGSLNGTAADGGLTALSELALTIPVAQLDCNNGTMNGKMREALRASAAPQIRFNLSTADLSTPRNNRFTVQANGQLSIAGQARPVAIQAQGQALGGGRYRFSGQVPVTMSQFGVRPPTAMMGTLRTGDRTTVHFDVTVGG